MNRSSIPLALSLLAIAACSTEAPTRPQLRSSQPLFAKPSPQTLYAFTWQGGLESDASHPFSALEKAGDPFGNSGIDADGVYLFLPSSSGGEPHLCDAGFSLGPSTQDWGDYGGLWIGHVTLSAAPSKQGTIAGNFSYNATRSNGTGWIWLVAKGGDVALSNGKLTVSFTNTRGLVSAYSTHTGSFDPRVGPFDAVDRCLTFSVAAAP